jgi:hypothetical protein
MPNTNIKATNEKLNLVGWIRAVVPILVIFSSIIISYNTTMSKTEKNANDIELLKSQVHLINECIVKIDSLQYKTDMLDNKISTSLVNIANILEVKTLDRWSKADDYYYMREFSHRNNLELPSHDRVVSEDYTRSRSTE